MILEVKKYGLFKVKHYTVYFTLINIKFLSLNKHAKLIVTSFQISHRYNIPKISFTHTSLVYVSNTYVLVHQRLQD